MIKGFLIDYGGGYNEAVDTPEDLKRIYRDYLNDHYKNPYLTKRQVEQAENILADYEAIMKQNQLDLYGTTKLLIIHLDLDAPAERLIDKLKSFRREYEKSTNKILEVIHRE